MHFHPSTDPHRGLRIPTSSPPATRCIGGSPGASRDRWAAPDGTRALIAEHLEPLVIGRSSQHCGHVGPEPWATNPGITAAHTSWNRARGIADRPIETFIWTEGDWDRAPHPFSRGAWRGRKWRRRTGFGAPPAVRGIGIYPRWQSAWRARRRRTLPGPNARPSLTRNSPDYLRRSGDPALTVAVAAGVVAWMDAGELEKVINGMDSLAVATRRTATPQGTLIIPSPLALTFAVRGNASLLMD